MAIVSGIGKRFLEELGLGLHDVVDDTIKCALYGPNATLNSDTEAYTTDGEVSGGGYAAGGDIVNLIVVGATGSSLAGGVQFEWPYIQPDSDTTITAAGVAARGFMIYNASSSLRTIAVGDFGETRTLGQGITFGWDVDNITQYQQVLIPLRGLVT